MKKLITLTLTALFLFSACSPQTDLEQEISVEESVSASETTASETTEQLTVAVETMVTEQETTTTTKPIIIEEEEVEILDDMPEMVFLLLQNASLSDDNIAEGLFIDNNGIIKEFSLNREKFSVWSNKNPSKVANEIITNYNNFIEYSEDTGRKVDKGELDKNWELFKGVNKKSDIIITYDMLDDFIGFAGYYGIRINSNYELEIIPLKGRGDILYDNTDLISDEICDWLVEIISFEYCGIKGRIGINQYAGKMPKTEVHTLET